MGLYTEIKTNVQNGIKCKLTSQRVRVMLRSVGKGNELANPIIQNQQLAVNKVQLPYLE
jgi:hypothetical protein